MSTVCLPALFTYGDKYSSQILRACFKNKQAMVKYYAAFGNCICKLTDGSLSNQVLKLQLEAAGKNRFLRNSLMKMCLAFALSENRYTSQKYKSFSVLLLENVKQLTRNSYLEANLVLFARLYPKGSNFCLVFGENSVQPKTM